MNISISGADNVIAELSAKVSGAESKIAKGVAIAGKIVEGEAKANCPVSTEATRPGGPHGELRQSITSQSSGNTAIVGTNKEYAAYVEFGTYKMAAQPYLVPALKSKESEIIAAIKSQF